MTSVITPLLAVLLPALLAGHEAPAVAGGQEDVFPGKHGGGS